ncbi:MAG: molybdopterin-dependent oxidoreductase [Clostridiales Family XIII bacterium]|jgi:aldehyde oxidoreductase|nr:molybdopterin-dependent oxidoreductase [Clostridiales Family XIII bacterium]
MALARVSINLNNADRFLVFDPEKDTLAETVRRLGLTGTKVGCGKGVCGACSVILNGKVVRACARMMRDVEENSRLTTIEGIGTAGSPHPLQQAMITFGGIQCGFCTPGFIVSAKALLDANASPTREEVRDWFQRHRNICRCTGYKQIVDAVMAAAEVMRGEKTMRDITFDSGRENVVYNTGFPRPTALSKACGTLDYGDDMKYRMPPGTLHLALVQPKAVSHARILGIDASEAEGMPGVARVITAKDVKGDNLYVSPVVHPRATLNGFERRILVDDVIKRYGDVVAVVAADTEERAREAAKRVKVELEPLPECMSFLEAVAPDAMRVHAQSPNIYIRQPVLKGEDAAEVIEGSYCSVEGSFHTTREPHLSIEGDSMQSYWDSDGNLTILCKSMSIEWNRRGLCNGIGLPYEKIRIIENPSGGSFGWSTCGAGYGIIAACQMLFEVPLTLTMSYEEFMHFSGKRCASYSNGRLACDEGGRISALEFDIGMDHGAYTEVAHEMLQKITRFCGFPYNIPSVRGLGRMASSNHNFGVSYRGFGSCQAEHCSESLVDMLAAKMGMDPFEFRRINIARPGDETINQYPYPEYPMEGLFDMIEPLYREYRERARADSSPERPHGVGVCCAGFNVTLGDDHAEVELELNPDGTVSCLNTWEDLGQGGDIGSLALTHKALEPLGLRPDQIRLIMNDSHRCPVTGIAAGSRSHYMAGNAIIDAAGKLMKAMRKEDGSYRSYGEMAAEGRPTRHLGVSDTTDTFVMLDPNTGKGSPTQTNMYGVFIAEVEVDTRTGRTGVLHIACAADVGVVGNFLSVDGQAYGGISHTVGYALTEDYDDVRKHGNPASCGIPAIKDIPDDMTVLYAENPRPRGPFGSAGCSELFQSGNHMCVINGIYDAVGVRIYDLPATPEKVLAALAAKGRGEELRPAPYFLGSELYDELDEIAADPK